MARVVAVLKWHKVAELELQTLTLLSRQHQVVLAAKS
jgi:hypothetical protein